jgi:hypothetical protein
MGGNTKMDTEIKYVSEYWIQLADDRAELLDVVNTFINFPVPWGRGKFLTEWLPAPDDRVAVESA